MFLSWLSDQTSVSRTKWFFLENFALGKNGTHDLESKWRLRWPLRKRGWIGRVSSVLLYAFYLDIDVPIQNYNKLDVNVTQDNLLLLLKFKVAYFSCPLGLMKKTWVLIFKNFVGSNIILLICFSNLASSLSSFWVLGR